MSDLPGGGSTQSDGVQGTPPQPAQMGEIIPYALIALASFLCGIGVLVLMIWRPNAQCAAKGGGS
jgi:hypothetical protein